MLSNECKYGIRAVVFLVNKNHLNKYFGSKEIAEHLDIPAPFLAKILQKLSRGNIISSAKGPGGGFYLTAENRQSTLMDIVNCLDGPGIFEKCFLGLPVCNDKNPCAVHHLVVNFRNTIRDNFQTKALADLADLDKGMDYSALME
jgi:Rrf2 family protein